MKKLLLCLLLTCTGITRVFAQNVPTDKITVTGSVKKEFVIDKNTLKTAEQKNAGSVLITNHLGQPLSTLRNVKGVKIKDLLKDAEIDAESPDQLNEFYFVFVASDGYKVVFSWNELFNTVLGDEVYIIMERDNIPLESLKERLALISPMDEGTGRRYVKNLEKIIIKKTE